ncbi:MAG: RIP metalloprotease RseP [Culturomica sp.]|jgi:regulator of sigma E protease|nr:RIP metalloprotease RseP [Culturomica sp.]
MEIFIKIVQVVLSLSILVLCHEFGHFLFAKLFKTRVEKFYLFFDPWFSLFKFKKGETEYGVGWLPLGGYVKIAGMIDESMDTEQMKQPPKPWEFRSKPAWQRLLIMLGGVTLNILLAFAIYICVLFTWGDTYLPAKNVENGVVCDTLFHRIGLQNGDVILSLDSVKVEKFYDILPNLLLNRSQSIQVKRANRTVNLPVPETFLAEVLALTARDPEIRLLAPRRLQDSMYVTDFADYSPAYDAGIRQKDRILTINGETFRFYDQFSDALSGYRDQKIEMSVLRGRDTLLFPVQLEHDARLGIAFASTERWQLATIRYSLLESIPAGVRKGIGQLGGYLKQFKLLFTPKSEAYKSVGGILMIGSVFSGTWNWQLFWELTALISIMLAVVNILPIPALDGGHVLFLLYEIVTGRKPEEKFLEYAQMMGMLLILGLFLLANINDIFRFFG